MLIAEPPLPGAGINIRPQDDPEIIVIGVVIHIDGREIRRVGVSAGAVGNVHRSHAGPVIKRTVNRYVPGKLTAEVNGVAVQVFHSIDGQGINRPQINRRPQGQYDLGRIAWIRRGRGHGRPAADQIISGLPMPNWPSPHNRPGAAMLQRPR